MRLATAESGAWIPVTAERELPHADAYLAVDRCGHVQAEGEARPDDDLDAHAWIARQARVREFERTKRKQSNDRLQEAGTRCSKFRYDGRVNGDGDDAGRGAITR